ncbi:hypothetical protein QRX50_38530 [Amycolatopsis carbonis]|uniref:FAD-binding PCMH-type domain-containing protein n=1 Tax=Amycolatopsis carbonis TaxID=715471 RepID=A0A9Y2IDR4_9PSEU|nr:hypothetical protein [Amycolatopsis sp. 2-15]WIX77250.1 hypothetical protein QRX50_38530 [Amycolatopsis sp. 2-15]
MTAAPTDCPDRLAEVTIDPIRLVARVGAAVRWRDVLAAAAEYGLTPVAGARPDACVVEDTLTGGLSPVLGRRHGYAADRVRLVEIVSLDGVRRTVKVEHEPELFRALCRGETNAVVTAMVVDLFPYRDFHGGVLRFTGEILPVWREWAPSLPDESTTSVFLCRLLDGGFVTHLRFAHLGGDKEAERLLAPMRAAAQVTRDSMGRKPFTAVGDLHDGVLRPTTSVSLRELSVETVDDLVGPSCPADLELHALGGSYDRAPRVPDAVPGRGAAFRLTTYW